MLKKDFPIFKNNPGLVYLDSAATLQKPETVITGVAEYLKHDYANIHRGRYSLSETSELLFWQSRQKVAQFIGADDEEVIYTANSTDSVNKLVKSLIFTGVIGRGDTVLLSELEHHANIVPRQIAAEQHGIVLDYIGVDDEQQICLSSLQEKLHKKVKVVSLTMVSNVTGGITDIHKIVDIVEKSLRLQHAEDTSLSKGGLDSLSRPLLILDASQAVPHMHIDARTLGADFLYFTGHKLGALTGVGVLRGKKEHLQALKSAYGGGGMIDAVTREGYTTQGSPDKFEPGTPNLVGAISMKGAIEYLESVGGYEALAKIEEPLVTYCLEQFEQLASQGVTLLGPKDASKRIGVFSFLLPPGKNATQLGQWMAEKNICIRCGAQCAQIFHAGLEDRTGGKSCVQNTCRISLWGYNDISDVVKFFEYLRLFLSL